MDTHTGAEKNRDKASSKPLNISASTPETILIQEHGIFLGKESERLVISKGKDKLDEIPFFRIREIIVAVNGVTISSDLIYSLMENGIKLFFTNETGEPYALVSSALHDATILTRRQQLLAFYDTRGGKLAKAFASGKISNMRSLLLYLTKNSKKRTSIADFIEFLEASEKKINSLDDRPVDEIRATIMGIEGAATQRYWEALATIVSKSVFVRRQTRGASDPFNSALNYGYGILYGKVWASTLSAGLDPFGGFLHVDRPGKPSLVLDLIEEFRQPVVDRAIVSIFNKKIKITCENGLLKSESKRIIASRVLENLETTVRFEGKFHKMRSVIQIQARHLAAFLKGERNYHPYRFKW